ncbi:hypothetical protein FB45DRAFT_805804 [Roridomyces roridus]|uniref:F-box domain-containing protein n=1 Tax=Roridomyces roridus TaxID=1738132 RepID=A0AAD7FAZ8_9AGAR|nr:hypothetical protein FB45DRAFT_805804 [Roridomyces roridus]
MTSTCSECGALKIAEEEPNLLIPATTSWTLARCQKLAKSNEPPNAAEAAFLRAVVPDTAARLACLEQEISRLKERLAVLETERAELADYQSQNAAILSPLRRMPSELIAEIFSWSLPTIDEMDGDRSDVKKSPWALAQVSSRWRNISLSTPSLWSMVQVWGKRIDDSAIKLVRMQVERARKLKVHFYASEDGDSAMQVTLFDFLSEHAPRWEEFSVQLTPALAPRLDALRGRLPSLQRLWIQWDNAGNHIGDAPIKCFETAPSLLDVGMTDQAGALLAVPFPTHRLTSYRLQGRWDMHQRILTTAPNIVEAGIQILTSNAEASWPETGGPAIDLSRLRRLYVDHLEVLDYIRAPQLDEIAIWMDEPAGVVDRLDSFLLRSSCITLRQIYFNGLPHVGTTVEVLKKHLSITSLVLSFGATEEENTVAFHDHLSVLSVQNDAASIASPHLAEISLGFPTSNPIDYPLCLQMLQSRRKHPSCALTTATFVAVEGPGPDLVTLAAMKELGDGGLDVLVRLGSEAQKHMDRWMYACPWI